MTFVLQDYPWYPPYKGKQLGAAHSNCYQHFKYNQLLGLPFVARQIQPGLDCYSLNLWRNLLETAGDGPRVAGRVDKQSRQIDGSQATLPQPRLKFYQLARKSHCTVKGHLSSQVGLDLRDASCCWGHTSKPPDLYFCGRARSQLPFLPPYTLWALVKSLGKHHHQDMQLSDLRGLPKMRLPLVTLTPWNVYPYVGSHPIRKVGMECVPDLSQSDQWHFPRSHSGHL